MDGILGITVFDCTGMTEKYGRRDFHFANVQLAIANVNLVILIGCGGHQTEIVLVTHETNAHGHVVRYEFWLIEYVTVNTTDHIHVRTVTKEGTSFFHTGISVLTSRIRIFHSTGNVFDVHRGTELSRLALASIA